MSISIDDLVSSLSSSHIGQEAMDLAALQAQLAQTLAHAIQHTTSGQSVPRSSRAQPCNTPTAHTPSASLSFADAQRYFDSMSRRNTLNEEPNHTSGEQMEEDERMVEDLLLPQTPMSANGMSTFEQCTYPTHAASYAHPHHYKTYSTPFSTEHLQTSSFTANDPFYQQAVSSHGINTAPPSVFSQTGRPSHHSPFLAAQKQK